MNNTPVKVHVDSNFNLLVSSNVLYKIVMFEGLLIM